MPSSGYLWYVSAVKLHLKLLASMESHQLELGAGLLVVGGVTRDWLKHLSFSNVASDNEKDETKKTN